MADGGSKLCLLPEPLKKVAVSRQVGMQYLEGDDMPSLRVESTIDDALSARGYLLE